MDKNDYIGKTLKLWPILVDHFKLTKEKYAVDELQ